jgi:GNAT superfamily N-acetyltransferase
VKPDSAARSAASGTDVRFAALNGEKPGVLVSLLERVYAPLLDRDPQAWRPERLRWRQFDAVAFEHLDTIGSCTFLTWPGEHLAGFASYDPRQGPDVGIIGHNCVVPEFQRQGIGTAQIHEILRRFRAMGIGRARVTTLDLPFFTPARKMYIACGFTETGRTPWDRDPTTLVLEYEKTLDR